jgi:septum formation protein
LGIPFNILVSDLEEKRNIALNPKEQAEYLAIQKVREAISKMEGSAPPWILGVDTLISLDEEVLGKPADRDDARAMLLKFRGRSHVVITSLALYSSKSKEIKTTTVSSSVHFADFSEKELDWYLDSGEWQGVAGAYQVQGLASCFISHIEGSYSAIVGLPIHAFYVMMKENGYSFFE